MSQVCLLFRQKKSSKRHKLLYTSEQYLKFLKYLVLVKIERVFSSKIMILESSPKI